MGNSTKFRSEELVYVEKKDFLSTANRLIPIELGFRQKVNPKVENWSVVFMPKLAIYSIPPEERDIYRIVNVTMTMFKSIKRNTLTI